ncbi:hypothetical protein KVR01_007628 [Diaporthe batatas]|uniref:uncharacterized protein n=1 Tax=Diaporthe batatas TaxID=748121 RepID=UPI001D03D8D9|nr:uncharacterized protein KVR01_007628 [Diaporthe batatas]KAG8163150.1 hypothetical protein KVR01_007628 [Diaporthe batatas]
MAKNTSTSDYVMADVKTQNQLWYLSLKGNLHKTVLPGDQKDIQILDVGTGTGVWAVAMAKKWPDAKVVATDLTLPPQTDDAPPNLSFIRHNANDPEWPFEKFHFIHGRMLDAGIRDWPAFRATCFRHLLPGGHLELAHVTHPMHSELPEFDSPGASPFLRLMHQVTLASKKGGIDYDVSSKHLRGLADVGFEDIEETAIVWPIGTWPQQENEREIGMLGLKNTLGIVDLAAKSILTHQNFMGKEEADDLVQAGRDDLLQTDKKHFYLTMKLFTAKKPCTPA